MTKKWLWGFAALVLTAALAFTGLAFAQGSTPPPAATPGTDRGWDHGMMGGGGPGMHGSGRHMPGGGLHRYMQDALAEALGLSRAELDSRLAAGETHSSIASELGFTPDEFAGLMRQARAEAIAAAGADGAISQEQADWMLERRPGLRQGGGPGSCPMHPGRAPAAQDGPPG